MRKKLTIVIALVLVIIAIIVGVLVSKGLKDTDKKKPATGTELEIKEDNGDEEDRSDASGSWEDETPTKTESSNVESSNGDGQNGNQSGTETGGDKKEDGNEEVPDEDTLIDDKVWGDVFS